MDFDGLAARLVHLPQHRRRRRACVAVILRTRKATRSEPGTSSSPFPRAVDPAGLGRRAAAHDLRSIIGALLPHYRTPPIRAQYLLLFHEPRRRPWECASMGGKYLGNTPTVVGGPKTRCVSASSAWGTPSTPSTSTGTVGHPRPRWNRLRLDPGQPAGQRGLPVRGHPDLRSRELLRVHHPRGHQLHGRAAGAGGRSNRARVARASGTCTATSSTT